MRGCRIEGLSNIIGFQTAFHIVESNYIGRDADFLPVESARRIKAGGTGTLRYLALTTSRSSSLPLVCSIGYHCFRAKPQEKESPNVKV